MVAFYIMKPYSLESGYQIFGDIYCLHLYLNLKTEDSTIFLGVVPRCQNKGHSPEDRNMFSAMRTSNFMQ
jgi:hypothetical protein